jgi:hypothetical protein
MWVREYVFCGVLGDGPGAKMGTQKGRGAFFFKNQAAAGRVLESLWMGGSASARNGEKK